MKKIVINSFIGFECSTHFRNRGRGTHVCHCHHHHYHCQHWHQQSWSPTSSSSCMYSSTIRIVTNELKEWDNLWFTINCIDQKLLIKNPHTDEGPCQSRSFPLDIWFIAPQLSSSPSKSSSLELLGFIPLICSTPQLPWSEVAHQISTHRWKTMSLLDSSPWYKMYHSTTIL